MIVALGTIFFGLRDSSPYTAVVSKPTHDQNAKNRPDGHRAGGGRRAEGACGQALERVVQHVTVWFSMKPSGPPPEKITENASAQQDEHLHGQGDAEDGRGQADVEVAQHRNGHDRDDGDHQPGDR